MSCIMTKLEVTCANVIAITNEVTSNKKKSMRHMKCRMIRPNENRRKLRARKA